MASTLRPNFTTRGQSATPAVAGSGRQSRFGGLVMLLAGTALASVVVWHLVLPIHPRVTAPAALRVGVLAAMIAAGGTFCLSRRSLRGQQAGAREAYERMSGQLAEGRAVCWAGPVYLLPKGLQSNGRVYLWGQIDAARTFETDSDLFIHVQGKAEPVAAISTSAKNYTAGLQAFRELTQPAAPSTPVQLRTPRIAA